jgi:DNA-binding transcriptional ArsR family regulator
VDLVQAGGGAVTKESPELFTALSHVVRRRILRTYDNDEERLASPIQFANILDLPLSKVNYHVTVLANTRALELMQTRTVRGATEHLYRLAIDGQIEWVRAALDSSRESDGDSARS